MFPFLIGTVRTKEINRLLWQLRVVSIPHRYGKNYHHYKHKPHYPYVSIPHRYGKNFLKKWEHGTHTPMFPFLIGTVRTPSWPPACILLQEVSIPHRYGKNQRRNSWSITFLRVSIPHRYGKNDDWVSQEDVDVFQFPFLIGTVRTKNQWFQVKNLKKFPFLIGTVRTWCNNYRLFRLIKSFHSS